MVLALCNLCWCSTGISATCTVRWWLYVAVLVIMQVWWSVW